MAGLKGFGSIGNIMVARTLGIFLMSISKRIFPFKGSSDEERMLSQYKMSEQQSKARMQFEAKLHASGYENQRDINMLTAFYNRQTTLQNSILSFSNSLKSKLFDEALRNYPLNIPPLVMLQNAGVSINSVTGELVVDDPIAEEILSIADNGADSKESLLSRYKNVFRNYPIALNVFITPLLVDSRIPFNEKMTAIVWDNIFQSLESLFVNEYNRSGERPVNFYPAAWNQNAKPGLHAAEILYFFTKGLPVIVMEPRFDGRHLRILFSCWGVGSEPEKQIRQEIVFDIDWNSVVLEAMYKRSVESLGKINRLKQLPQIAVEAKRKLEHNKIMFEKLRDIDGLTDNPITEDITKLFFLNQSDYAPLSKMMADALGIGVSLIADIHHLTARGISPHFPDLLNANFNEAFQSLSKPARHELVEAIGNLMKSAYIDLLLGDYDSDSDFPAFKDSIEKHLDLMDSPKGIIDNLEHVPEISIKAEPFRPTVEKENEVEVTSTQEIWNMINHKCDELGVSRNECLKKKVEYIKEQNSDFISMIEGLLDQQGVSLNDFIGE